MHAPTAPVRAVFLGFLLVLSLATPRALAQGCQPGWAAEQFNLPGVDGTIHAKKASIPVTNPMCRRDRSCVNA